MSPAHSPSEMVRQGAKHRLVDEGETTAYECPSQAAKVAMGRTYPAEGTPQCHQTGTRVEPTGEEEERAPQADLEEELAQRAERLRSDMGGGQDLRRGQKTVEGCC